MTTSLDVNMKSLIAPIALFILSVIGLIDSLYLTLKHLQGNLDLGCSIIKGCDQVLTSQFATINGIPIAGIGAGYYLVLAILALMILAKYRSALRYLLYLSGLGVIVYLGLIYVQAFVLQAWCQFCLLSTIMTLGIFSLVFYQYKKLQNTNDQNGFGQIN